MINFLKSKQFSFKLSFVIFIFVISNITLANPTNKGERNKKNKNLQEVRCKSISEEGITYKFVLTSNNRNEKSRVVYKFHIKKSKKGKKGENEICIFKINPISFVKRGHVKERMRKLLKKELENFNNEQKNKVKKLLENGGDYEYKYEHSDYKVFIRKNSVIVEDVKRENGKMSVINHNRNIEKLSLAIVFLRIDQKKQPKKSKERIEINNIANIDIPGKLGRAYIKREKSDKLVIDIKKSPDEIEEKRGVGGGYRMNWFGELVLDTNTNLIESANMTRTIRTIKTTNQKRDRKKKNKEEDGSFSGNFFTNKFYLKRIDE